MFRVRRRGIGTALIVGGLFIIFVGIVWGIIYYGSLKPTDATLTSQYYFDPTILTIVESVLAFWAVILTFGLAYYWWRESSKRDLETY